MNFGDFKDGKAQQPLPPSVAAFEPDLNRFSSLCNKTCARILQLLALALEVRFFPPSLSYASVCFFFSLLSNKHPTPSSYLDPTNILRQSTWPFQRHNGEHPPLSVLPVPLIPHHV
jgi:hypothetical protein